MKLNYNVIETIKNLKNMKKESFVTRTDEMGNISLVQLYDSKKSATIACKDLKSRQPNYNVYTLEGNEKLYTELTEKNVEYAPFMLGVIFSSMLHSAAKAAFNYRKKLEQKEKSVIIPQNQD